MRNFTKIPTYLIEIQWGSEILTSLDFEWSQIGLMPNGLVFKGHFNTGQPNHMNTRPMDANLFFLYAGPAFKWLL